MLVGDAPQDIDYPAVADATGVASVRITPTGNRAWLVSQVSIEMPSAPAGATAAIRKGGAPVTPLVATFDAGTGDPPITLFPGQALTVSWTGLTPGDRGRVYAVYNILDYS